jgi:putative addiction module component (TIGR02574 family)
METMQVYEAAMSLPDRDRADLAFRLLGSLKPSRAIDETSPEFEYELERRVQAYEAGETTASDWEIVSARLRRALEDRKSP